MTLLLGCIADDLTGATDLASMLVRHGMRTVQSIGLPAPSARLPQAQALIIALKTRTAPVGEATRQSVQALHWLRDHGARQFFFKYCSTFDSTDRGNIGPVIDALLDALGEDLTVCCPAYPRNGRTVYQGYLFVGHLPLAESPMRHHPLTPMTDSNLVRLLERQAAGRAGLIPYATVEQGAQAIRSALHQARSAGVRYAIADALTDRHLMAIGEACAALKLITGGSAVAMGLPENLRRQGLLARHADTAQLPAAAGHAAVIAGSCSPATLAQIQAMRRSHPSFRLDPHDLAAGLDTAGQAVEWARSRLDRGAVLIYSSAPPESVARSQQAIGPARVGELLEGALARVACGLVAAGVRRLIVAGGETAGAVMQALGVSVLQIGPEIDPGVPWTYSPGEPPLWLALKSGNFGTRDFFTSAFARLA